MLLQSIFSFKFQVYYRLGEINAKETSRIVVERSRNKLVPSQNGRIASTGTFRVGVLAGICLGIGV